tara:strand:+ start:2036 stop:2287 length:252 start_codon:yes stop_codon:yes gene_type:complete
MNDAINILSISPIDVIDGLIDNERDLTSKQIENILSLDNHIVHDAIYHAKKNVDLGDYYREIVEDAVFYLKSYVTSNDGGTHE